MWPRATTRQRRVVSSLRSRVASYVLACSSTYSGDSMARPMRPKTDVWVNESLPMTDSRSACEILPQDTWAEIDIAHAAAFLLGSLMGSVMSFEGLGKHPRRPRKVRRAPSSFFSTFKRVPRSSQNCSNVARAYSQSLAGTRAPKSSKYASSGIPKILLKMTEIILEKQL